MPKQIQTLKAKEKQQKQVKSLSENQEKQTIVSLKKAFINNKSVTEKRPETKLNASSQQKNDDSQRNQKKNTSKAKSANTQTNHNKISSSSTKQKLREVRTTPVRVFALGGLSEIGKNLYVYECANDMFIVDCGLAFPDEDMLGIDIVIPDFTYLEKNRDRFRGIILTHGHEDHIGALPYLLKKINVPVYGTKLTLGLVEGKLKEHGILAQCSLNVVEPRQHVKMGCMSVEFIRVNHSIPDCCALAIHTPAGIIVHTGDFKIDYTPIEGDIIDLARFGELGNKGVLLLLSESTMQVIWIYYVRK